MIESPKSVLTRLSLPRPRCPSRVVRVRRCGHGARPGGLRGIRAGALVCAAVALMAIFLPIAAAHPYGPDYYSLRSALRIDAKGTEIIAVVEVPSIEVLRAFLKQHGGREEYPQEMIDAFIESMFADFAKALSVRVDGQSVAGSWSKIDDPKNGKSGEGFFVFMLRFESRAKPLVATSAATIEVIAGCYPEEKVFLSGYAEAHEPWSIRSSSAREILGEIPPNADYNTCLKCWTNDPAMRNLRVEVERADGLAPPRAGRNERP